MLPKSSTTRSVERTQTVIPGHVSDCSRKVTPHGLLPDVRVDVAGDKLFLLLGEGRCGKLGEYLVHDEDLHVGLRLLFLPEAIELGEPLLKRSKQFSAGLLDPFASRAVQPLFL